MAATDGSALGNPGPGGWGWATEKQWRAGAARYTTNNAMELTAVRELLVATAEAGFAAHPLQVLADSQYVIKAVAGWRGTAPWTRSWVRNGWKTKTGAPVANRELLEEILAQLNGRDVMFAWVKGHAGEIGISGGHALNVKADLVARSAAEAIRDGRPISTAG